jgi:DNA polymerase III epsilon subunit-like protein
MVRLLVFDTETTGKEPLNNLSWNQKEQLSSLLLSLNPIAWIQYIDLWPHILQLSYICYDTDTKQITKTVNNYIDIPRSIKIPKDATKIHKITKTKIADATNKLTILRALQQFEEDVRDTDIIVGHNVDFDRKMIIAESMRHEQHTLAALMVSKTFSCTMKETTDLCKLKVPKMDKETGLQLVDQYQRPQYVIYPRIDPLTNCKTWCHSYKFPKLCESYKHVCCKDSDETSLHDSLYDVMICLQVYCSLNNIPSPELPVESKQMVTRKSLVKNPC